MTHGVRVMPWPHTALPVSSAKSGILLDCMLCCPRAARGKNKEFVQTSMAGGVWSSRRNCKCQRVCQWKRRRHFKPFCGCQTDVSGRGPERLLCCTALWSIGERLRRAWRRQQLHLLLQHRLHLCQRPRQEVRPLLSLQRLGAVPAAVLIQQDCQRSCTVAADDLRAGRPEWGWQWSAM